MGNNSSEPQKARTGRVRAPKSLILQMEGAPPTQNRWLRAHWHERRRINQTWYAKVVEALDGNRPQFSSVKVTFIRGYTSKPADLDNIQIKAILDALVSLGVLPDDAPDNVASLEYRQRKHERKALRSVLILEALE